MGIEPVEQDKILRTIGRLLNQPGAELNLEVSEPELGGYIAIMLIAGNGSRLPSISPPLCSLSLDIAVMRQRLDAVILGETTQATESDSGNNETQTGLQARYLLDSLFAVLGQTRDASVS